MFDFQGKVRSSVIRDRVQRHFSQPARKVPLVIGLALSVVLVAVVLAYANALVF